VVATVDPDANRHVSAASRQWPGGDSFCEQPSRQRSRSRSAAANDAITRRCSGRPKHASRRARG
jgi:hypothetical protein